MISFIVIGKNEGPRLERSLQSVLDVVKADSLVDWELIYVDSQSMDDSVQVAKSKGARTFLIIGECNAAIARNIGSKEAKGDIFFFIDGDMEVQSGFLSAVIENNQLTYPFMSGDFEDVTYDNDGNYLRTTHRHKFIEGEEYHYDSTTGGLFLITRELWEQVGGMDNRFKRSQDYDLGLRVGKVGYPLKRMNMLLAKHHMCDYELRNDVMLYSRYTALLFRKHWLSKEYLPVFICSQYTAIMLVLSLLLLPLCYYSVILYAVTLIYKWWQRDISTIRVFLALVVRDIVLLVSILFYYPKSPQIAYKYMN